MSKQILTWVAILCGFVSAYFWFKASTVIVANHSRHDPGVEMAYTDKKTGREVFVVATAMEQSRVNKIAAVFTGLSALFQSVAAVLH